ncbi:MAG: hypothetical protein U5J64_03370 [Halobacteriales archaeon]|nr:hypothetical protein [Halobacteriales archaeon]
MKQDWDNLIILDACRYDIFKQHNCLEGELEKKLSRSGATREFIQKNLTSGEFHDTVYVDGNGHVEKELAGDEFYKIVKTYTNNEHERQGWMPDIVYEKAKESYDQHPDKRLLVHFMQPHAPFLGEKAEKIRKELEKDGVEFMMVHKVKEGRFESKKEDVEFWDLFGAYEAGYISREQLHDLYVENLEIVLEYVEKLLDDIDGKTVVTSDHGELLGEFTWAHPVKRTGHLGWIYSKKLREVPWLEIDTGERRDIVAEEPVGSQDVDEEVVKENLRALGYVD